jgi:hypothetical protein
MPSIEENIYNRYTMAQVTTVSATSSPSITTGKYYFLKGRFKSAATNLYGLFLVIYNHQKSMESFHIVSTSYSSIYDLEPHQEWHRFETMITDHRWKGSYNTSMTASLASIFEGISKEPRQKEELYGLISSYNYQRIEVIIFDLFNRMIRDKSAVLETGIQEATLEEVQKARETIKEKPEEKEARPITSIRNVQLEDGAVVIPSALVLSPVRGKQLYELKVGDRIMMKFNPETQQGAYYIDSFKLRTPEGKLKGIPAEVIDIHSESKSMPVDVLARIEDHLYARAIEEDRHVRVCLYDPRIDGPLRKNHAQPKNPLAAETVPGAPQSPHSSMTYLMMGLFAFLFLLLLFLIYLII